MTEKNKATINGKDYDRTELSVEANQMIERIALVQSELNKQQVLLGAMEVGSQVLLDQLSKMLEAETKTD